MPLPRRPRPLYRFKRGETVPGGLKRIAREQLDSSVRLLTKPLKGHTEAVHEARKSLKKVRAILRLMRKELGAVYDVETTQLRLRGRQLSPIRDAAAQLETIDLIKKKAIPGWEASALAQIRRAVAKRKQQLEQDAHASGVFAVAASALRVVARRVKEWPLHAGGFAALAPGIEKTFRRGHQAFRRAHGDPIPENLHAWRRRVKELWYQMRVLEPIRSHTLKEETKDLKHLQDLLGEHQNLAMLRAAFAAEPEVFGDRVIVDEFLQLAEREQTKLRGDALALGEKFYRHSAKEFMDEVERSWKEQHARIK